MQFTPAVVSAILLFSGGAFAAPIAQLAGEGAAANSILSSTDNGVGFGVERYAIHVENGAERILISLQYVSNYLLNFFVPSDINFMVCCNSFSTAKTALHSLLTYILQMLRITLQS